MKRIVYAPEVFAYVSTSSGALLDISPDIISGQVMRNTGKNPSTVNLTLQNTADPNDPSNPNRTYMGGQILPMDRIVVYLKKDYPTQVFSGYIDLAPYWQPYPRPVVIEASCTLKRLLYTYWDPSLPVVFNIMNNLGFNLSPVLGISGGYQQTNSNLFAGQTTGTENNSLVSDTGFSALLRFLLEDVGQWNSNSVYIEPIPQAWVDSVTQIYQRVLNDEQSIHAKLDAIFNSSASSGPPSITGTGGKSPATAFSGNLQNEIADWTQRQITDRGLEHELSTAKGIARTIAIAANSSGSKYDVDPRLLVALASLENFGLVKTSHIHIGTNNVFGGPKDYSSYAEVFATTAKNFQSNKYDRHSIQTIIDGGSGRKGWFNQDPAGNQQPGKTARNSDGTDVARFYESLLDHSGLGNITWTSDTLHPTQFGYPKNDNPPRPQPPAKPPAPVKNAYIQLHAYGKNANEKLNYTNEEKDNLGAAQYIKNYIDSNPSWKMTTEVYGSGFDTVNHDISVFIRHADNIQSNGRRLSISVHPKASANSFRLAEDIQQGLADQGLVAGTNFTAGLDHNYIGLTKDHAKASVVVQLPAVGYRTEKVGGTIRPANETLLLGIINGLYKYKYKVLDPTLTEHKTYSTEVKDEGMRLFPSAYSTKITPQRIVGGQEFRFKSKVPFCSIQAGTIVEIKKDWNGIGKDAIVIKLSSPIHNYNAIFIAGGEFNASVLNSKGIKAGEVLGTCTSKDTLTIGFAETQTSGKKTTYNLPTSLNEGAQLMHNLLVAQMPELVAPKNANSQWIKIPGVDTPTIGPIPSSSSAATGINGPGGNIPGVPAFNVSLNVPLNITNSVLMTGYRSFENDIQLLDSVDQICTSSQRVYASLPDGSFIAWYPDYFNITKDNPYYYIRSTEVVDFTIDINDNQILTHSYVIGAPFWPAVSVDVQNQNALYGGGIASIDMPGLVDSFFNLNSPNVDESVDNLISNISSVNNFFNRYGVRPSVNSDLNIRHPIIEFFYAYQTLIKAWAAQFVSTATFTFLPDLFPGMIAQIETNDPNNPEYCVYVEQVTHDFDYTNGFTTSATITALSRPTGGDAANITPEYARVASLLPGAGPSTTLQAPSKDPNPPGQALVNTYITPPGYEINPSVNFNPAPVSALQSLVVTPNMTSGLDPQALLKAIGWNG